MALAHPTPMHHALALLVLLVALAGCGPAREPSAAAPRVPASPAPDPVDPVDPSALGYVTLAWPTEGLRADAIVLGCAHACVLAHDGSVSCWGRNQFGELADGTTTDRETPMLVAGLPPVAELASTCASTCARTRDGAVWCWGGGDLGEIADGDLAGHRTHPVAVPGLTRVLALAGSGTGLCAVLDDAGQATCWGSFDDHPGAPLVGADATRPRALTIALGDAPRLAADSPFRACVLGRDGIVTCWGAREVQNVSVAPIDPATPMAGLSGVRDLAAGSFLTCASDDVGVSCWGTGVLAFSLGSEVLPPSRIAGIAGGASIAVGDDFVCATHAGTTSCAGYGELVDATGRVHALGATATRVPALAGLAGVVAGPTRVCGLTVSGEVRCVAWLSGHEGEPAPPPS